MPEQWGTEVIESSRLSGVGAGGQSTVEPTILTLMTTETAQPPIRFVFNLLLSVLVLLPTVGCSQSPTDKDIQPITTPEFRELVQKAQTNPKALLLLDARSPRAFQAEHLPGATNMQLYEVNLELGVKARLKAYKTMVVYGDDAGSPPGRGLTKRLMGAGYDDVRFYVGGMKEWKAAGFPVETGDAPALNETPKSK